MTRPRTLTDMAAKQGPNEQLTTLGWRIETPDTAEGDDGTLRPSVIMERISRHLDEFPQGLTKRSIRTSVSGGNDMIDLAVDLLVDGGFVTVDKVGQSHLHVNVRPYRA